ncbi:hypothetical protein [Bacillus sp. FJAT-45037]|uniref:hypothetical protein n=1 Tax=Bacillus sp. FJAT-45037 TaxID=2011007 RepID=UPI000C23A307|nr:hypothetical protein [Bacillus sp. FJAT-45037]
MLNFIYEKLLENQYIVLNVGNRIKFYEYPPTDSMEGVYIVIDPLDVPRPGDYADDQPLTDDYLYQIEVWSQDYLLTNNVAKEVRKVMLAIGFGQGSGVDEWDSDTRIYRDARRYEGKVYVSEII